jgi:hypothetical protein
MKAFDVDVVHVPRLGSLVWRPAYTTFYWNLYKNSVLSSVGA